MYPAGTVRIPGHEVVGDIAGIGEGVAGLQLGERVFVAPNMGCGHCRQCVSGNNNLCANYGAHRDHDGRRLCRVHAHSGPHDSAGQHDPDLRPRRPGGAALIEPFACVLRGQDAVGIQPGDIVLVVGAGPIGVMHAMLARLSGAGRVIVSE